MTLTHKDIWTNVGISFVICIIIFLILFFWLIWLSGKQYDNENDIVEEQEEAFQSLNLDKDNGIIPKFSTHIKDNKFFKATSANMIIESGASPIHHSLNTNYKIVQKTENNSSNNNSNSYKNISNCINLSQISKNIGEKINKFNAEEVKTLKKSISNSSMNRIQGGVSFARIDADNESEDDSDSDNDEDFDSIAIEL